MSIKDPVARSATDPLTLEVIKNALGSVADEMALMVMRSAYSPVVRDTMDYSTALCDRRGQVIAQGLTLAVQLGTFPTAMRHLLEEFGDTAQPGDVYVTNDPYGAGGQHLPDIYVVKPIFVDGELEGWAATMAHHSDVGGITPGSVAVHATEIYQEGLRMPLLKLFDAGEENTTLFKVIEKNTRQPVQVLGDLRAQVAACRAGEQGLTEIVRRYGSATTHAYTDELQSLGERLMRAARRRSDCKRRSPLCPTASTVSSTGSTASATSPIRCGSRCCCGSRATSSPSTSREAPRRSRRASTARSASSSRAATARSRGSRNGRFRTARATCARSGSTRRRGRS